MNQRLLFLCWALAILPIAGQAYAQFTEPHAYDNTPVGTNQLEVRYAYAHANASIDTSLIFASAKFNLNQGTIDYTRYFGLLHRLMWVEASVPIAGLGGSITGANIPGSAIGAGDSSYQMAVLLKGGPALNAAQFDDYEPATILGVSLSITAPTGLYNANKILNLGSDRWSFKPEIALSHPFGHEHKWQVDAYANVYFYSDNTSYHGRQILRQEPLPGLEGHISYSFNNRLWGSFDTRYSLRGSTLISGVSQNNPQQNFVLGSEMNLSLNHSNTLALEFANALVHHNGPAVVSFSVKYDYTW